MLVAAPERWDEACFAIPAVRALMAAGLAIGVLCPARQRGLWETLDGLEIIAYPESARARRLAAELGNWQSSLAWQPGFAVDVFAKARILRRLGREDTLPRRSLTHPLAVRETPGPVEHRVRHYLAAIEELGIPTHKPEFFAPAGQTPAPEAGTVLLSPDSDFGSSHEWELERWLEIGRALAEASVTVTVAGMPGGRGLGRSLAAQLGGDTPFFEAAPGAAMLPLLAVHSVVVAADGSLPHLAAHAGATCLTLFGPSDPAWRRPLGRRHSVVRRHVECAPCFLAKCPIDHRCLRELEAGRVLAALRAALETAATSAFP
jgi:ADP-heptose:LPS heptosyltransferase